MKNDDIELESKLESQQSSDDNLNQDQTDTKITQQCQSDYEIKEKVDDEKIGQTCDSYTLKILHMIESRSRQSNNRDLGNSIANCICKANDDSEDLGKLIIIDDVPGFK